MQHAEGRDRAGDLRQSVHRVGEGERQPLLDDPVRVPAHVAQGDGFRVRPWHLGVEQQRAVVTVPGLAGAREVRPGPGPADLLGLLLQPAREGLVDRLLAEHALQVTHQRYGVLHLDAQALEVGQVG